MTHIIHWQIISLIFTLIMKQAPLKAELLILKNLAVNIFLILSVDYVCYIILHQFVILSLYYLQTVHSLFAGELSLSKAFCPLSTTVSVQLILNDWIKSESNSNKCE